MKKHIVLTGGPGAGKTSSLKYLYDNLADLGWRVIIVPEAASLILSSTGRHKVERNEEYNKGLQRSVIQLQKNLPHILSEVLTGEEEKVLYLHDRAELDNRVYSGHKAAAALVKEIHGKDIWQVAHSYDAVVHLLSAANGAEEVYTQANNETRWETAAEAKALDKETQRAWMGHPCYKIVPNYPDFEDKLLSVLKAVLNVLGEPESVESERKWLLEGKPDLSDVIAVPVYIIQHYFQAPDGVELRVRERTVDDHSAYYITTKTETGEAGVRVEDESAITKEAYLHAVEENESLGSVVKTRWCFAYEGQHFELDHITGPTHMWILEAELVDPNRELTLPDFGVELLEVTEDPYYTNYNIATENR